MPPADELKKMIISELQLGGFAAEQQAEVVQGVAKNILDELLLVILEKFPDDAAREKFTSMAEAGDMTALKAYARSQIENFDTLVATTIKAEIEAHKS